MSSSAVITFGREIARPDGGTTKLGTEYWVGDEPVSAEEFRDAMALIALAVGP